MSVLEKQVEQLCMVGFIYSTSNCHYIEFTALMTKPINYAGVYSAIRFLHIKGWRKLMTH